MADHRARVAAKIKDLNELPAIVGDLRGRGQRIVHCHGVFDLLHIGHIRHFHEARQFGDVLIVTLTPDIWVNKGPHRPAFEQRLRAEMLANLESIDYVAINRWPTAIETIQLLRPDFFVKGSEFREGADVTGAVVQEKSAIEAAGGKMVFTEDIVFSSSSLVNRFLSTLPQQAADFLPGFVNRFPLQDILRYLDDARKLKVLVLGETIIDEYHFCEALGKSGKEPILAVRFCRSEKFAGGALAVANHLASFTERVSLLSCLGEQDSQEEFIQEHLAATVVREFFTMPGAPTIVKRRYIEQYPFQKLFEVYHMKDGEAAASFSSAFCARLEEVLPEFDLVVVADYGHGLLIPEAVEILSRKARCLAVNTQTNAANQGFNTASKYPRADFLCLSEREIRLEVRQRNQELHRIVETVAERLGHPRIMVTRGMQGNLCYEPATGFSQVPALTGHFSDRVGAGDAVFAVISLCMAQGAPPEILSFIGNAVGAIAVEIVGNRSPVQKVPLVRFITSLFK